MLFCLGVWISCNLERIEEGTSVGGLGAKFSVKLGGGKDDMAHDILVTKNGAYLITGESESFVTSNKQAYLVKIDVNGKFLKEKAYGGAFSDEAHSALETSDGGFIICGSYGRSNGRSDVYILRVNSDLDTLWTKVVGSVDSTERGVGVVLFNDTSFVLGYTSQPPTGSNTVIINARYSINGKLLSTNRIFKVESVYLYRMKKTVDNKIVFIGGISTNDYCSYILKCKEDGSYQWEQNFCTGSNFIPGYGVTEMNNGDLILAGSTLLNNDSHNFNLAAYNDIGGNLWNYNWGGANADELWSIVKSNDNEIVVAGYTQSFSAMPEVYISKRRLSDRSKIWENHFSNITVNLQDMKATKDGGYIIVAEENSFIGNSEILVFKMDSQGNYQ